MADDDMADNGVDVTTTGAKKKQVVFSEVEDNITAITPKRTRNMGTTSKSLTSQTGGSRPHRNNEADILSQSNYNEESEPTRKLGSTSKSIRPNFSKLVKSR